MLITMVQAVQTLGLQVQTGVSDINILCPKCSGQHSSSRLTMNVNYEENVFRCPRCGFSGGVYAFIAFYKGWEVEDVEAHIRAGDLGTLDMPHGDDSDVAPVVRPLASLPQRHEVYTAMLQALNLTVAHRADLVARGLSNAQIDKIGFKSYPRFMDLTSIPQKLVAQGLDLRGVPGFGLNSAGAWSLAKFGDGGFLIPNRNGQGLILGFQIRFDHPTDQRGKYGYFSSKTMDGGTACGGWCCWAGDDIAHNDPANPFDVILIEGPLKAYIVNALSGHNVISVPGVAALKKVPSALQQMKPMGLRNLLVAYDMDSFKNPDVANHLQKLCDILDTLQISHKRLTWDANFNGLDDWIVQSGEF